MTINLTPSDFRPMLRKDFCAFMQRCFYELNPTIEFSTELAPRRGYRCTRGLSAWKGYAVEYQSAAPLAQIARCVGRFSRLYSRS